MFSFLPLKGKREFFARRAPLCRLRAARAHPHFLSQERKRNVPTHRGDGGVKGGILFSKRIPPLYPPEKDEGFPPRPRTLAVGCSKNCSACGLRSRWQLCCLTDAAYPLRVVMVRCTWLRHESLLFVTGRSRALLREVRVTLFRRQTACGMQHRCARRLFLCVSRLFCGAMRGTPCLPPANRRSAHRFS